MFSDLADLPRRALTGLVRLAWRPFADAPIQVEAYADGGSYIVRAELPGLDPHRDIQLAFIDGELRIRAERSPDGPAESRSAVRSDFRYGAFYRAVPLPQRARADLARARYDRGILEVRVSLDPDGGSGRTVAVARVCS